MGHKNIEPEDKPTNFEMFRLTKSKVEVGISPKLSGLTTKGD